MLGEGNTLYRFGGEELVAVFIGVGVDECSEELNGWRHLVAQRAWRETELRVTFSGGVTSWRAGDSAADIVKRADVHLYTAKHTGKNRIIFDANAA